MTWSVPTSWQVVAAALGWLGALSFLGAYVLVSTRRVTGDGLPFQVLNLGGAVGLGAAAFAGGVWPSVVLNAIWTVLGVAAIRRLATQRVPGDWASADRPT